MQLSKGRRLGCYFLKTPETYSKEEMLRAAHLYYRQNISQKGVAVLMKVSQAKIARMLAVARQRGLVNITVAGYDPHDHDLEQSLLSKFPLKSVAVIKTLGASAADCQRRFVAHFGAPFIASIISPGSEVVMAGGRTIAEMVQRLPEDRQRHVSVLQALGVVDIGPAHLDAILLGRTLAQRWGGSFMPIEAPAMVMNRQTRDWLLRQGNAASFWQRLGHADAAIVAVGTPTNSVFAGCYAANPADLAVLQEHGAVGEICGRFFDRAGRECDSPWRDQVISVELDQLRQCPQVIALVAGRDRSIAVASAIHGGLVKSLVIDFY